MEIDSENASQKHLLVMCPDWMKTSFQNLHPLTIHYFVIKAEFTDVDVNMNKPKLL